MKVSVIIPHYNDLTSLDLCLASLERQTIPVEDFEIIVADNASPQGKPALEALIGRRARLVVINQRGAGPARNGGVAASRGEILAFTDSDCQPEAEWLAEGLAALPGYDFVGGRIKVLVKDPGHLSPAEAFERVFAFDAERYVTRKGFVATCNLFCTRRVFDAVGEFGVGISEDVDWSHRATARNFRIGYAPRAIIGHPARRNWQELKKKWLRINAETYALTIRRKGGRLRWILLGLMMPASALAHTPRVIKSRGLQGVRQRVAALQMLYRLRFWRMLDYMRLLNGRNA